ncbi:formylglycine-generating enzyme family protein [Candidatus Parabeggiatoa sp. HSG14]|uniref:formylglycine-generating enzyme family protein n=1 Tax=Candidatus Parabeggiatoa sp. HSG14 TaxID=3055593 RepID=UPI0025A705A9|nr:formylglycine-generating enzyme family protein [Thiotrichales bacterium HSG14]
MKTHNMSKIAKQWLLLATLIIPITSFADSPKITIDVVSKDEFVLFLLKNYENRGFHCSEIRVQAKVVDKDGRVARRSIIALGVILPANSLEIRLEAGKEVIAALRNEMNQPRIVDVSDPKYSCEPKIVYVTADKKVFRDRLKDGSLGPEMARIPAGRFRMGDIQGGGDSDEKPVHWVSVDKFAMGKYEVTFAEYDEFAEATGRKKTSDNGWGRGNRPVMNVSWYDAVAYAEWLSQQTGQQYRLPTEAEWEYAARAGTETKYWWGNDIGKNRANCDGCGSQWYDKQTAPVGSFQQNPFGLYDTAGNVWEWTCSEYEGKYKGKENQCLSKNYAKNSRLSACGGSLSGDAWWVRSANRDDGGPNSRNVHLGFRLARP